MMASISSDEIPTTENTALSARVRRMFMGFDLHSWEHWMLGFLAIVAIGGVGVVMATYAVVKLQRAETAQAKKELEEYKANAATRTAEANERAAEANARAQQANLELQKLRLPRFLDGEGVIGRIADKPKWPVIDILYVDESDSSFLATKIMAALNTAKWGLIMPRPIPGPNPNFEYGRSVAEVLPVTSTWGAQSVGISVVCSSEPDPDGRNPAVTLWTALAKEISEGQVTLGRDTSMAPETIRIVVAPRR
jgi:hypothetical protein